MPFFGVPIRNGLPLGLGSVVGLAKQSVAPSPPPPSSDPYFEYVNLLLNTTSTNGAQNNTFLDSSTNNFTVTRNGDTTQGSFNPYMPSGYWSGYFDGSGDYLSIADNAALELGSSDFTIECWVYLTGYAPNNGSVYVGALFYKSVSGSRSYEFTLNGTASSWTSIQFAGYDSGGVLTTITGTQTFNLNTWYHVAAVRNGNNVYLYVNGVQVNSTTAFSSTINNATSALKIGGAVFDATYLFYLPGYISNSRLVVGTAVYTAAFTPPTTPLTAITNTSLLCLQDNRFKDNSTNAFAITRNGDTRISKFAPFNPPASWDAATYGGSGYFDGTGDSLSIPDNAALEFGNGNFTIEFWVCPSSTTGWIIGKGDANTAAGSAFSISLQNAWTFYSGGTSYGITQPTLSVGEWAHCAIVRNGTTITAYKNGTSFGSVSISTNAINNVSQGISIGQYGVNAPIAGYISNLRVVVGTAVYTANFTPPTAPVTAITNTSLLLNFTNAGIYDAATINDVRTVGNLQVSTTQAKFGTTSMYFDGTGDYGDVLSVPENAARTGAFTLETWAYLATADAGVERYIFFQYGPGVVLGVTSGNYVFGATYLTILASTNTIPLDQWVHIALVREGTGTNQFKLYVNGVLADTGTSTRDLTQSPIRIGATNTATSPWKGYLDEMRMTNGYARYTGNFTPPTAAFPTL